MSLEGLWHTISPTYNFIYSLSPWMSAFLLHVGLLLQNANRKLPILGTCQCHSLFHPFIVMLASSTTIFVQKQFHSGWSLSALNREGICGFKGLLWILYISSSQLIFYLKVPCRKITPRLSQIRNGGETHSTFDPHGQKRWSGSHQGHSTAGTVGSENNCRRYTGSWDRIAKFQGLV